MQPRVAVACFKGTVKNKLNDDSASTISVCTGEVKPRDTKTVHAVFDVGAIAKLCRGKDGLLEWDRCSFTVNDVTTN
jgi:hypothetical protein